MVKGEMCGGRINQELGINTHRLLYAAAAAKSHQSCLTLCDPIDGTQQAPPSLGFSRKEYWSGLPFPSPDYCIEDK